MSKVAHIWVRDEVWMTVSGITTAEIDFFWNKYGIEVEGSFYMPARRLGRWDGKLRFFEKTGKVFLRFIEEIAPYLEKWGYDIELHDERLPFKLATQRLNKDWFKGKTDPHINIEFRPYQIEAVNAALDATSGMVIAATGAGKTLMVAGMCDVLGQDGIRTLTIVPSSDLVLQTSNTFKLCNIDHGTYSGDKKDTQHMHVIGTWQALQNNPNIVTDFQCVIVDEAHGASAKTIGDLITNHGKNIGYRFGFTGTLPKPKTDQYTLRGSLGDVLYDVSAKYLIDHGYLAKLEIEPIEIQELAEEEFPDYSSEKAYTARQPDRLDLIADLIIDRANQHGNTLVLVHSIKQGQQLQKLIKDSVFLQGATENEVRAEWYGMFEHRDDLIVIATSGIASTGISIDRVFNLMLLDAGKSFIKCIQSIGRGLRKGHDKDRVHVCDVYSGLKWGRKHARERAKYYKEAGYPVRKPIKVAVK